MTDLFTRLRRIFADPVPAEAVPVDSLESAKRWYVADHKGWGDHIGYFKRDPETKQHRWEGHTTPAPRVGEYIVAETTTGEVVEYRIIAVQRPHDPPDQWFATTERLGRILS